APAWLSPRVDRTDPRYPVVAGFDLIPAAAEALRLAFRWRLEGAGSRLIARRLNESGPWAPPGSGLWRDSTVQKLLTNRAVIGECQPHSGTGGVGRAPVGGPLPGYYPAAVDPGTFAAVQKMIDHGRRTGGAKGQGKNLLPHVA